MLLISGKRRNSVRHATFQNSFGRNRVTAGRVRGPNIMIMLLSHGRHVTYFLKSDGIFQTEFLVCENRILGLRTKCARGHLRTKCTRVRMFMPRYGSNVLAWEHLTTKCAYMMTLKDKMRSHENIYGLSVFAWRDQTCSWKDVYDVNG